MPDIVARGIAANRFDVRCRGSRRTVRYRWRYRKSTTWSGTGNRQRGPDAAASPPRRRVAPRSTRRATPGRSRGLGRRRRRSRFAGSESSRRRRACRAARPRRRLALSPPAGLRREYRSRALHHLPATRTRPARPIPATQRGSSDCPRRGRDGADEPVQRRVAPAMSSTATTHGSPHSSARRRLARSSIRVSTPDAEPTPKESPCSSVATCRAAWSTAALACAMRTTAMHRVNLCQWAIGERFPVVKARNSLTDAPTVCMVRAERLPHPISCFRAYWLGVSRKGAEAWQTGPRTYLAAVQAELTPNLRVGEFFAARVLRRQSTSSQHQPT